jgi:ubiquinone/menaquinone biosynthesis C-methylase UbiE
MGQVILKDQWSHVLSEMLRVLKPGGTIELIEVDSCHHHPGPVQKAFDEFSVSQCEENGLIFDLSQTMQQQIESSGYVDIDHNSIDIPVGEWPQDAGKNECI